MAARRHGGTGNGSKVRMYTRHTNAPMTVFVPQETVVDIGGRFVKIVGFLLIILARLENSGMVARRHGDAVC